MIFFLKTIAFSDMVRYDKLISEKAALEWKGVMMLLKQTEYKVGMYMRLSHDDERAGESLSIENQRTILTRYIEEQGWTVYDEYIDAFTT